MPIIKQMAAGLTLEIKRTIANALSCKAKDVNVDAKAVLKILTSCWWSGTKSKMFLINPEGDLIQFNLADTNKELPKLFTHPVTNINVLLKKKPKKVPNTVVLIDPWAKIISHLKTYSQRESLTMCVDMFATNTRVDVGDDVVDVMFTHKPFESSGMADPQVIADYKKHFPSLDSFLELLVASRFAADRKRSYIWLHCDSDWGKNLLMDMIKDLGGVTMMSVKEAEAAFEGKPVGLSFVLFKRSIALVFDEFKTVKSELKQLQNTLTISPKQQLRTEVQIYTKIFMSKEAVPSLAGDHGIEDQFANRFCYIRGEGSITDRKVYQAKGIQPYASALQIYICEWLNKRISVYIAKGPAGAAKQAEKSIDIFRKSHAIDLYYDRFSISMADLADQFGVWILKLYRHATMPATELDEPDIYEIIHASRGCIQLIKTNVRKSSNGVLYLKKPKMLLDAWLTANTDNSSRSSISHAQDTLFKHLSLDGAGCTNTRIDCNRIRHIKLKNHYPE